MIHRHLNHQDSTLAASDDLIARGRRSVWAELYRALLADPAVAGKVLQVCAPKIVDPDAQRHHFWNGCVSRRRA